MEKRKNKTKLFYPDYQNSLVQVANSILKHYGANCFHNTLKEIDNVLENNYKNVVLIVFDGMGTDCIEKNLPVNSFFRQNISKNISSVYPCTTTAALTSILSGLTPSEHGWVGWSCYFKEEDKCVDLFTNNESNLSSATQAADVNLAKKYSDYTDILSIIKEKGEIDTYAVSPFSDYYAADCETLCEQIKNLCNKDGKKFIYAYHFNPDKAMHDYGCYSDEVKKLLKGFDRQIENLTTQLDDTLFIITADHGLIDTKTKAFEDYPEINNCLLRKPSVESRCVSLFIKDEYLKDFSNMFKKEFGDKFILLTHDEFLNQSFLGEKQEQQNIAQHNDIKNLKQHPKQHQNDQHPKVEDFIGDFVAIAVSDLSLWYKNDEGQMHDFKARHAGISQQEMIVPLIIVTSHK